MAIQTSDGQNIPATTGVGSILDVAASGLPFRFELSLEPLIRFWTRGADEGGACGAISRLVNEEVRKAPELLGVIQDPAVLQRHRDLLDTLMVAIFPPASWDESLGAATIPFRMQAFYATPPMERFLLDERGGVRGRVNLDAPMVAAMRRASAYALVLRRLYGLDVELDYPIILTVPDPDTGLERHFRVLLDPQFIDVSARGPLLLQDYQLIEKLAHQNRERIPERPVHAKGWGAYGTLTITGDISKYTKAKCLQPGAKT